MEKRRPRQIVLGIGSILLPGILAACGSHKTLQQSSQPLVTDVAHTQSKRQSIGNCWLYAAATWVESMELAYNQETLDVSESYWTWWHFYNQLIRKTPMEEINTAGSFDIARSIILNHGLITEAAFIPIESDSEMSYRQRAAENLINGELAFGDLKNPSDRTPEKVRQVLDEAFGTNMAEAETQALAAEQLMIDTNASGKVLTLRELLDKRNIAAWREVSFPRNFGEGRPLDPRTEQARKTVWNRVFRALNDRQPVIMSLMIDFNALDNNDGTFKGEQLRTNGIGHQGGHLTVLEDYTVKDVPGIGVIGRGDVSDELKQQALLGNLDTLFVKNSWGVNRPERGIKDGITGFDRDYLESQFPWKADEEEPASEVDWYTTLSGFILPPGY